ncbi:hypothetical protein DAI22_01g424500 [Oryza sativa Japonica Group]|nr:hypothetical protein DAI22_01g424500 [Oryza sativa Japonica Group]
MAMAHVSTWIDGFLYMGLREFKTANWQTGLNQSRPKTGASQPNHISPGPRARPSRQAIPSPGSETGKVNGGETPSQRRRREIYVRRLTPASPHPHPHPPRRRVAFPDQKNLERLPPSPPHSPPPPPPLSLPKP